MEIKKCKTCACEITKENTYQDKRGYFRPYCKNCEKERNSKYKSENLEEVRKKNREYGKKNKNKRNNYNKQYYRENREKLLDKQKEYWSKQENKDRKALRKREQWQKDENLKISANCRNRIYKALKRQKKSKSTEKLVGCSFVELKVWLENKFSEGMSWNNYGEWHIDHILPCASFDLSKKEEQEKCFHYTNLQPLWGIDNLIKSYKII
jgi:hypothetical protein